MDSQSGLEDKADKIGSNLEKLKKARAADKAHMGDNTNKTRETDVKLAEQAKRVVTLEGSVKKLAEKVDRDSRQSKSSE